MAPYRELSNAIRVTINRKYIMWAPKPTYKLNLFDL